MREKYTYQINVCFVSENQVSTCRLDAVRIVMCTVYYNMIAWINKYGCIRIGCVHAWKFTSELVPTSIYCVNVKRKKKLDFINDICFKLFTLVIT